MDSTAHSDSLLKPMAASDLQTSAGEDFVSQHNHPDTPSASASEEHLHPDYERTMTRNGFRFTLQRREVYDELMAQRDHPTATEVFLRVKEKVPSISLATVYNCLETLATAGLVKQVSLERGPARYCPNLEAHGHFHCSDCGCVIDVRLPEFNTLVTGWSLPEGALVVDHEVTLRGICPDCSSKSLPERTR
jgi:Fur family peroxide stress response transcriptional regulator